MDGNIGKSIGIYDQSADLHRAIAWSDAYYGDGSSVAQLYRETGKPVIIQDADIIEISKDEVNLSPYSAYYDDGKYIWFPSFWTNFLCRCSKEDGEVKLIGSFAGEEENGADLFESIARYKELLIFVPHNAAGIHTYNMSTGEWTYTEIPRTTYCDRDEIMTGNRFSNFLQYGKLIYMFPKCYPAIVKFDCESKSYELIKTPIQKLNDLRCRRRGDNLDKDVYFVCFINTHNSVKFATVLWKTNIVFEFDICTEEERIIEVGSDFAQYDRLVTVDDFYYLIEYHERRITKWNRLSGKTTKIAIDVSGFDPGKHPRGAELAEAIYANGYIWLFPHTGNVVIQFDVATEKFRINSLLQVYVDGAERRGVSYTNDDGSCYTSKFAVSRIENDWIYLQESQYGNIDRFLFFNPKTDGVLEIPLHFNQNEIVAFLTHLRYEKIKQKLALLVDSSCEDKGLTAFESKDMPIDKLLNENILPMWMKPMCVNKKGTSSGEKIYSFCKDLILN